LGQYPPRFAFQAIVVARRRLPDIGCCAKLDRAIEYCDFAAAGAQATRSAVDSFSFPIFRENYRMSESVADQANDQAGVELASPRNSAVPQSRISALTEQFRMLKEALERPVSFERRQFGRISLPLVLQVTPLDQTGQPLEQLATTSVGKDISPRGISFFHERPLPYRRAIVTFEHPDVGRFGIEVDVSWCRFTSPGWYQSGGRLIRTMARAGAPELAVATLDRSQF
jgi:hypothetical protein